MAQPAHAPTPAKRPSLRTRLIGVVDRVPATRGCGVIYRKGNQMIRLRPQGGSGATVVFELHERDVRSFYVHKDPARPTPVIAGWGEQASPQPGWSVRAPRVAPPPARPLAKVPVRSGGTSVLKEWASLGLNCGGAAIAWVGVAGAGAAAPVTGGLSGFAAVALYAGAAAASGQCAVSVFRVGNEHFGRHDINQKLDKSQYYRWSMLAADGIGMYGAYGAYKAAKATNTALRASSLGWTEAAGLNQSARQGINYFRRRELTVAMGLQATVVGTRVINRVVRQQLLDGAGAVIGMYSSYDGGVARELIVWITEEK